MDSRTTPPHPRCSLRQALVALCAALATLVMLPPEPSQAQDRYRSSAGPVVVERMVRGLHTPWSIAFLPDMTYLISERGGRLFHFDQQGRKRAVDGVPEVWNKGQGGLLDIVVARNFPTTRRIYLSFSEPRGRAASTALAKATLSLDFRRLEELQVIFRQESATNSGVHFGSRIVEAMDGNLFLTVGERGARDLAQSLRASNGKVLRLTPNGDAPTGNPFNKKNNALDTIWSYGHRNPQGAALDLQGLLITHEHGPRGGDEINRPRPGSNYGWPIISHGQEYRGGQVGKGTEATGLEQPLLHWTPSIAPSGLLVYSGKLWPRWRGSIFTGSLKFDFISHVREDRNAGTMKEIERLFEGRYRRIRDIREAPDGTIWFLAETDGAAYRIQPDPKN